MSPLPPPIHDFVAFTPSRVALLRCDRERMWAQQEVAAVKPKRAKKPSEPLSGKASAKRPRAPKTITLPPGLSAEHRELLLAALRKK